MTTRRLVGVFACGVVFACAAIGSPSATDRQALRAVIAEAKRLHAAGVPVDEVTQARFGDLDGWTLRSSQAPIAIRRVYLESEGKLK